jgi:hypothetical protein
MTFPLHAVHLMVLLTLTNALPLTLPKNECSDPSEAEIKAKLMKFYEESINFILDSHNPDLIKKIAAKVPLLELSSLDHVIAYNSSNFYDSPHQNVAPNPQCEKKKSDREIHPLCEHRLDILIFTKIYPIQLKVTHCCTKSPEDFPLNYPNSSECSPDFRLEPVLYKTPKCNNKKIVWEKRFLKMPYSCTSKIIK